MRRNNRWPQARRTAVFFATLLLALAAGWRFLPVFVPSAKVQPYRVRVKVQLPAAADLPRATDEIRTELTRPAAVEDALAAAGIESHEAGTGPSASVREQLEIETRTANSGFDLLVSLPQVAKVDAPAAAVVVNRLVESWLAAHARSRADAAGRAHAAAQAELDQARRQMAQIRTEYETLVNQIISAAGSNLGADSQQNVAQQAAAKMRANIERRVAELRTHRTEMLETRTSEHPEVIATGEELALLESRLREFQSESPTGAEGAASVSLREQLNSLRRRLEGSHALCDRLAVAERAAYDQVVATRDRHSLVWFPATGIAVQRDSATVAWRAVIVLSAVLLAGLACLLVPQPSAVLRTLGEVESSIGAPVVGVIASRSESRAA